MNKIKALKRVASLLALNTMNHRDCAKKFPLLAQNAYNAAAENRDTAIALGIDRNYSLALENLMRGNQ